MFSKTLFAATALVAGMALSAPAAAVPLFFDFAATNPDFVISFTIDSHPTISFDPGDPGTFTITNVLAMTRDGEQTVDLQFYDLDNWWGGFEARGQYSNYSAAGGVTLFQGDYDNPSFAAGTYTLTGFGEASSDGVLTVSEAGVPEAATWAMMVAGFGLAGAAMRRRQPAVRFA